MDYYAYILLGFPIVRFSIPSVHRESFGMKGGGEPPPIPRVHQGCHLPIAIQPPHGGLSSIVKE